MYTCLVVDDNEIERDAVVMHLERIPRLKVIGVCENGVEASEFLRKENVDIVFSDIDMPYLSGTSLAKNSKEGPVFIFVTSFSEYAAESFELDALDFIVKPATFERLLKAANKATDYLDLKRNAEKNDLLSIPAPVAGDDHIFVKETKGLTKVNFADLIYVESMGDFSRLHTKTLELVVLVSLKSLEVQLPSSKFFRSHKQFMINVDHIETVSTHQVHLTHNFIVPISNANRQDLLTRLIDKKTVSRFSK